MAMASDATKSGRNFGFKRKPCSIPKALLRSTGLRGSRFLSPSQSPSQSQSNTSNGPKPKADQEAPHTMTATPSKAFLERYSVEGRTKTKTRTQGRVFSFLLPHECDRVNGNGNGNGNGNSDSTKTSPRSTLSSSSSSLTSESSFGTSSGNSSNTSSNNNNNNNTNDDANLGDIDSDVSASGDANYTGDHPDHSSSSSFKEGFISDDDDKDDDDNDAKDKNKDRVPNESVNGLGLDFSIARSRIADEAASEALVRWGSREFCTVVSIGKGSSQADRILARDRRPIWQQGGYDCGCCCCKARKGDDETQEHGHLHGPHSGGDVLLAPAPSPDHQTSARSIPSSIAGIAERAAASAFARQKQRKESIDEAQAKSQLLANHHGNLGFSNGFEEKENKSASVYPLGDVREALARDKDSEKIGSTTDSVSLLPTFICGDKGTEVIAEESLGDKEHDDPSATGDDRGLLVDAEAEEEERPKTVVLTNRLGVAAGLAVPTESDSFGIEVVEPLRQTATSDNDCDANSGPAIILVNTVFCKNMLQDPGSSNSRTSKIRCHGGNSNKDTDNEEVCWEDIMDSDASVDGSRVAARPPPALSSSSPTRIFVAFAKVVGHMSSKLIGIRQMKEAEENTTAN